MSKVQLTSDMIHVVGDAFPEITVPTPNPQEHDHSLVLLGKQAALLKRIWQLQPFSGVIFDRAGNALQVLKKLANIAAGATDTVVIAAPGAGFAIRVLSLNMLGAGTATDITFGSKVGAGATVPISPLYATGVKIPVVLPFDVHGQFNDCEDNGALVSLTGAGTAIGVMIRYVIVPVGGFEWNDGDPIQWNDGSQME